jgi:hypothetical protein
MDGLPSSAVGQPPGLEPEPEREREPGVDAEGWDTAVVTRPPPLTPAWSGADWCVAGGGGACLTTRLTRLAGYVSCAGVPACAVECLVSLGGAPCSLLAAAPATWHAGVASSVLRWTGANAGLWAVDTATAAAAAATVAAAAAAAPTMTVGTRAKPGPTAKKVGAAVRRRRLLLRIGIGAHPALFRFWTNSGRIWRPHGPRRSLATRRFPRSVITQQPLAKLPPHSIHPRIAPTTGCVSVISPPNNRECIERGLFVWVECRS